MHYINIQYILIFTYYFDFSWFHQSPATSTYLFVSLWPMRVFYLINFIIHRQKPGILYFKQFGRQFIGYIVHYKCCSYRDEKIPFPS